MPEISRFLGIIIFMNFNEHNPLHFHARYGDYEVSIDIDTGLIQGRFPKRALRHVLEWYEIHKQQLLENWYLIQEKGEYKKISPLE